MVGGTEAGVEAAERALGTATLAASVGAAEAQLAYSLMNEILQNDQAVLIFPSLMLTLASVGEGLTAYETTVLEAAKNYAQTQAAWQEAQKRAGGTS